MFKSAPFFFLWLVGLSGTLSGQQDSIIHAIKNASETEPYTIILNKITDKCGINLTCMMPYLQVLGEIPTDDKVLSIYYNLGSYLFRKGLINDAKTVYLSGMKKAISVDKNHKSLFNFYSSLSNLYYLSKVVMADSAFYYISESEKILESNHLDIENYWKPNYNRYLVYVALKKFDKADEYLEKSYSFLKNSSNRMQKGYVLFTLLEATKSRGSTEHFKKYLDEFITFKKSGNKELDINHLGIMELFTDKAEAQKLLEESLKRVEKAGKPVQTPDARRTALAQIYKEKGEIDKAIDQYLKILNYPGSKGGGIVFRNALYSLYEAYKSKNQPDQAYKWIEKYIALEDSMSNELFKSQIAEYEVKYQTKEKENQLFKQEIEIKNASLQTRTLVALLYGLSLIFFTVAVIYFKNVKFKTQMMVKDQEIREQKIKELENSNKLLSLNSVIEGQETERLRIAKDLHDGLGGLLTTIKAHFSSIQKEIQQLENLNFYNKTNKLIDEACIEVRRIAHDMVPYSIKLNGLTGALEDLKEGIEARGLPCDLDIFNAENVQLSEQTSNMIYRTIQEITTNAVKHANATKLLLQLVFHEKGLNILVEDNGKGFDINTLHNEDGMGIKSVESRVRYLGGKIHYDSTQGHGTTVSIEIPFTNEIMANQNDKI